tara:strand:- start:309 stop:506 length:198 start_codon:yes stop_codon:yes gene_type:complete
MTSQELLNATLLHFKAVKARAEANLNIYLTAVVGVGEHADLVKEIIELTKTITEADEAIKYLENK